MRIALCLHGLSGGKNSKNRLINHTIGYKCFKQELIDKYDVDVFIHSWTIDKQKILCEQYKPKLYKFQKQIRFCKDTIPNHSKNSMYSNWYSYMISDKLRLFYEKKHKFKYDCVIHSRFDIYVKINKNLNKYDMDNIYILNGRRFKYNNSKYVNYIDYLFLSNSNNMKTFCEIYNHLDKYLKLYYPNGKFRRAFNHIVPSIHLHHCNLLSKIVILNENDFFAKI